MNADKTRINADKMGIISARMARAVQATIDKDIGAGFSNILDSLDRRQPTKARALSR